MLKKARGSTVFCFFLPVPASFSASFSSLARFFCRSFASLASNFSLAFCSCARCFFLNSKSKSWHTANQPQGQVARLCVREGLSGVCVCVCVCERRVVEGRFAPLIAIVCMLFEDVSSPLPISSHCKKKRISRQRSKSHRQKRWPKKQAGKQHGEEQGRGRSERRGDPPYCTRTC